MSSRLRRVAGSALLALCGLLAACGGDPDPTPGVPASILSHKYDDPDTWTEQVPHQQENCHYVQRYNYTTRSYGSIRECDSTTYYTTEWRHDGPHWFLKLYQCGHKQFKKKNNADGCGSWWHEVGQQTYDAYKDGEKITF